MKFLTTITTAFILLSISIHAQNFKTEVILGETYGISYNKANDLFTICEKSTTLNKSCSQKLIPHDNVFVFQEKLKETLDDAVETFSYKIFGKDLKLSELNTIDYKTIEFNIDSTKLKTPNNQIKIQLKNAPAGFPEFKIQLKSDQVYELSSDNVLQSSMTITYADDIETTTDAFKKEIQLKLDSKKNEIADAYAKKIKEKFRNLLEELYNTTITLDTDYAFLTSETLTDTSNPPVKNIYNF